MRHGRRKKKLGVTTGHRKALLRSLVRNLVIYRRIRTTVARAKSASAFADKMITIAKRGDLHARRTLISYLGCPETADKLILKIAPHFKERQGGYTRVLKLSGFRAGDTADMAILEWTAQIEAPAKPKKKTVKKAKPAPAEEAKSEKSEKKSKTAAKEVKTSDKADEASKEDSTAETKKESEKKGGFLGALRKFLKGDEK